MTNNGAATSSGEVQFADVNYSANATIYLEATGGGYTKGCFGPIVVQAGGTKLAFSTQPSAATNAGTNMATQPVVEIRDDNNILANTAIDPITLTAYTDITCTTLATGTTVAATNNPKTAVAGVAAFDPVTSLLSPIVNL